MTLSSVVAPHLVASAVVEAAADRLLRTRLLLPVAVTLSLTAPRSTFLVSLLLSLTLVLLLLVEALVAVVVVVVQVGATGALRPKAILKE